MPSAPRSAVELFHLVFLAELGRKLDPRLHAVKGGCNLRFFFKSPRYSEDLDLDVSTVAVGTLHAKVVAIIESRAVSLVLGSKGLRVQRQSAPKQTDTTQRFKVELSVEDMGTTHTKIEFSRRKLGGDTAFDPVDPALIREHGIAPFLATHYTAATAFAQKVHALAGRAETQARDIFDLDLLLRAGHSGLVHIGIAEADREKARRHALSVDHDAFAGQVLAFLPPDEQRAFGTKAAWEALVMRVVDALEGSSR